MERANLWRRIWESVLGKNRHPARLEKVLEYVNHRISDGASLRDIREEEYVRRLVTRDEFERILDDPRIVGTARAAMRSSLHGDGKVAPR